MYNPLRLLKHRIDTHLRRSIQAEVEKKTEEILRLLPQLFTYESAAPEHKLSHYLQRDVTHSQPYQAALKDRLIASNIPVEVVDIDLQGFERWLTEFASMKAFYQFNPEVYLDKCLEHYLIYEYLNITAQDVYLDVGADESPWAELLTARGTRSYRLDLSYPKGISGMNIGADASQTDLPDSFASVLSLQHAYGHFAGDADIRFVQEADRILNQQGRYAIVPFYLNDQHLVATSPYVDQRSLTIEAEAKHVWRDDGYQVPFSRHYSPEAFHKRIFANIPKTMTGKILYFNNVIDIMHHYQQQKTSCFFMFYCEKK